MGKRRVSTLGYSDVFKSASHRRIRTEEVRTIAEAGKDSATKAIMLRTAAGYDRLAPARIETTSRDEYASRTVPDALRAVEQPGLFPSERPSSVGVRIATWATLILAGFLLMMLAGIGTAAILVDRDCEAAYGRNNCE
jgi:hypothetical protein